MAPKRKFTPTRNPLRFGASSSSDPSPSIVRFRDDDAFKALSENFSRWGIHSKRWGIYSKRWGIYSKRQVILSDFVDTDLSSVIHSRGWESLCDVLVTCPLVLI